MLDGDIASARSLPGTQEKIVHKRGSGTPLAPASTTREPSLAGSGRGTLRVGIARQGCQPVHFGGDMLKVVPAFGQGDAQDKLAAIAGINAEDTVHIVRDQAQARDVQA